MKKLGTYKDEYALTIDMLAELLEQYSFFKDKFKKSGYAIEVKCGSGGMKKSQVFAAMESLRKDIIQLSDRLCLNPKVMEGIEVKEPKDGSKLEDALGQVFSFAG
jgi:phage terminase small subunit